MFLQILSATLFRYGLKTIEFLSGSAIDDPILLKDSAGISSFVAVANGITPVHVSRPLQQTGQIHALTDVGNLPEEVIQHRGRVGS